LHFGIGQSHPALKYPVRGEACLRIARYEKHAAEVRLECVSVMGTPA